MWQAKSEHYEVWKGISLLGLTCNHLALWPLTNLSFTLKLTYQSIGWFTFATVYYSIAGIIWGRRVQTETQYWNWNLRRAAKLLVWVAAATLILVLSFQYQWLSPAPWQTQIQWTGDKPLLKAILGTRIPWLIDVIWLHCWLGIFTALLWRCPVLRDNHILLASVSLLVWTLSQFRIFEWEFLTSEASSWHSWTSWQLLFVLSALSQQKKFISRIKILCQSKSQKILAVAAALFLLCKQLSREFNLFELGSAQNFAPLFAINSLVIISLLHSAEKIEFPAYIRQIGRYSLTGYSLQCALVYSLGEFSRKHKINIFESVLLLMICFLLMVIVSQSIHAWRKKWQYLF
jgi:hypothetical protein